MSAAEHIDTAERYEQRALDVDQQVEEARYTDTSVGMAAVRDVESSGGVQLSRPRYTMSTRPQVVYRARAHALREQAGQHRRAAEALLEAEKRECSGVAPDATESWPFFRRGDIQSITAYPSEGPLRGAVIRYRAGIDLTATEVRQVLACAQAQAATLGYPPGMMAYSPYMVPGAQVRVAMRDGAVEVLIESQDRDIARKIWARSEVLLVIGDEAPRL
jgi:hypothetical protein